MPPMPFRKWRPTILCSNWKQMGLSQRALSRSAGTSAHPCIYVVISLALLKRNIK